MLRQFFGVFDGMTLAVIIEICPYTFAPAWMEAVLMMAVLRLLRCGNVALEKIKSSSLKTKNFIFVVFVTIDNFVP